uniref:Secreted protein n=1 Tax=Steinernema glaseri TaxID=37863 RepID=A0A1I7Y0T1_9BILA
MIGLLLTVNLGFEGSVTMGLRFVTQSRVFCARYKFETKTTSLQTLNDVNQACFRQTSTQDASHAGITTWHDYPS